MYDGQWKNDHQTGKGVFLFLGIKEWCSYN